MRAAGLLLSWSALACSGPSVPAGPDETPPEPFLPEGFPGLQIPEDNPLTQAKIELGRHLFYDARLSYNETQACSSCHEQARAFTDAKVVPLGSTGARLARNSSTLTNAGYNASLTWANPLLTELEQQLLVPIFGDAPIELGASTGPEEILDRFRADPGYQVLWTAAFGPLPPEAWSFDHVISALASFCRRLVSGDAPYDRYAYQGDRTALSDAAVRGLNLFLSERLECHHCHGGFNLSSASVHEGSAFGATQFHNTGLYNIDGAGAYPSDNTGVFAITGDPADMGRFRAPTLRNIAVTAPYFHDGSAATLEEVVRIYERGGRNVESGPYAGDGKDSPIKSGLVSGFVLSDQERSDLIAFLESLSDETFLSDPKLADPFAQN